jgi:hypothetical protein
MSPERSHGSTRLHRKSTRRLTRGVPARLTVGNDRLPDGQDGHQNRIFAKTGPPGRGAAVSATRAAGALPSLAGRKRER